MAKKKTSKKDSKKTPKKKVAKKKTLMKKSASGKIKAPAPKYALEEDVNQLRESIMELTGNVIERGGIAQEKREASEKSFNRLCELVGELTGHTTQIKDDFKMVENTLFGEISHIRKKLLSNRLIRKVTTESPNGTITTEETFSSEK